MLQIQELRDIQKEESYIKVNIRKLDKKLCIGISIINKILTGCNTGAE